MSSTPKVSVERPKFERADLLLCSGVYAGLAIGSLVISQPFSYALFVGWFIPARLAVFVLAATFSWLPHEPHIATHPDQATTVRSSRWLTWVLLGQNFHLVHHLDPSVPFYQLENQWKQNRVEFLRRGVLDRSSPLEH